MKKTLLFSILSLVFTCGSYAQDLVSYTLLAEWSAETINTEINTGPSGLAPAIHGAKIYQVLYTTTSVSGAIDTASGLLAAPSGLEGEELPYLVYQHGTTDNGDIPSNLQSNGYPAIYFAGHGYYSLAPDFLGLGASKGFHPYIHAESEAWVAYDMMIAAEEIASQEAVTLNDQVFVTGYSQGGHAAMALHKYLQEDPDQRYTVTASSPMSGPYSVSGIMRERVVDDLDYSPGIIFLPYVVVGLNQVYGDVYEDISDIFKAPYVTAIELFEAGSLNLAGLGTSLGLTLRGQTGGLNPRDMLQDTVVSILTNQSPEDHPILVALREQDLYDWVPDAPTRLFYCEADEQVPYTNSPFTDSVMNAAGAADVMSMSKGSTLNHGACFFPAGAATLEFFNGFLTTSIGETVRAVAQMELVPNPASGLVRIDFKKTLISDSEFVILDQKGQSLYRQKIDAGASTLWIRVDEYAGGVYYARLIENQEINMTKLIILD